MRRRDLLGGLASAGALGAAGCLSRGSGPGSPDDGTGNPGDGTGNPGDGTDSLGNETGVRTPSFAVVDSGCGSGDDATVSFADGEIAVDGTIAAPSPCHDAALVDASWADDDGGTLVLTVGVTDPDSDTVGCAGCVGGISYEATVTFDNDAPPVVAIRHEHWDRTDDVTTARRDG